MSESVNSKRSKLRVIPFPESRMAKPLKKALIYQLKITLKGSHPPIWRRILVPSSITFHRLHRIIQTVFDWQDCHLFEFSFSGTDVCLPLEDDFLLPDSKPPKDARRVKIGRLLSAERRCTYTYDFGDNWEHEIELEKALEPEPGVLYPVCVAGMQHAPLDDIGGIGGYYRFLEAISDPQNPEHGDMLDWIGGSDDGGPAFDPEECDLDQINGMLADL